jgi:predicted aldo/keto reductase-like oxidoreductase
MKHYFTQYWYKSQQNFVWYNDFGQQNTEAEGHAQMDYALENGVNFFDTADVFYSRIKIPRKYWREL